MEVVDQTMLCGIQENVFPGAVLLVSKGGTVLFQKAYGWADIFSKKPMTVDTVFDLASLTKPLATTLAVVKLIRDEHLTFSQRVATVLPGFKTAPKSRITVKHLLAHQSGLPAHHPYYFKIIKTAPEKRFQALNQMLLNQPLAYLPGDQSVYSDLGFMVLKWLVEAVSGKKLADFVENDVYPEYGILLSKTSGLHFRNAKPTYSKRPIAATELCPWRNRLVTGVVHDENAYAAGGVGGQAGLFGSVNDIHTLLSGLLSDYYELSQHPVLGKHLMEACFGQGGHFDRPLGFDIPSPPHPSCGRYFSANSVGHLGFTGTSFWIDLDQVVMVILLTNRIHPSRQNNRIKAFRPWLHDAVMKSLKGV